MSRVVSYEVTADVWAYRGFPVNVKQTRGGQVLRTSRGQYHVSKSNLHLQIILCVIYKICTSCDVAVDGS